MGNDPLSWIDPTGLDAVPAIAGGLPLIIPNPTPYGSDANKTLARGLDDYVKGRIASAKLIWAIASNLPEAISHVLNENTDSEEPKVCDTGSHDDNRRSLNDLIKDLTNDGRKPLSADDAGAAIDLGKELGIPGIRDDRGTDHWQGGPHIHIPQSGVGDGKHIPALPD